MGNMMTYVKKFGDEDFNSKPFNDVDALILSELVYLHLDDFVPSLEGNKSNVDFIPLLSEKNIKKMCEKTIDEFWCRHLLKEIKIRKRYQNMKLNYFESIFLTDKIEQFCAVTFELNEFIYIAFRGTDISLLGWYEDFNMLLMDAIPSQNSASLYLSRVAELSTKPIIIGGHSKGGNLAVYASLYADQSIKDRIIKIYDFDGPGFNKNIFVLNEYKMIENKIVKMTCEDALIGILLYHSEKMLFVKSRGISIFQHDLFNWKINKYGELKFVKNLSFQSRVFKRTVQEFIDSTSESDRERIVNLIFKVIMETPESTIFDVVFKPFRYSRGIGKRYRALEKEDKKLLKSSLKKYAKMYNKNFIKNLKRKGNFKRIK